MKYSAIHIRFDCSTLNRFLSCLRELPKRYSCNLYSQIAAQNECKNQQHKYESTSKCHSYFSCNIDI